jgi:membrane-associated phospholipid phosphatase
MSWFISQHRYGSPFTLLLTTVLLLAAIILDRIFKVDGLAWSNTVCKSFQTYYTTWFFWTMDIITYTPFIPAGVLVLAHLFRKDKWRSFCQLLLLAIAFTEMIFLKLTYTDPRPFTHDKDVKAMDCECTFGKPSGHALLSCASAMILCIELQETKVISNKFSGVSNYLAEACVYLYTFLVMMSRFYLGVHSIFQLALGLAFGLWTISLLQNFRRLFEVPIRNRFMGKIFFLTNKIRFV